MKDKDGEAIAVCCVAAVLWPVLVALSYGILYGVVFMLHNAFHFNMLSHFQVFATWIALIIAGSYFRGTTTVKAD